MTEKLKTNEEFYTQLAHLFYAFAAADKRVVLEEKRRIVKEVECYWDFPQAPFDAKEIMFATMRELICDEWDAASAYDSFSSFYLKNKADFSEKTKMSIQESSNAIIRSFSEVNKSELTMYTQLHLLFNNQ